MRKSTATDRNSVAVEDLWRLLECILFLFSVSLACGTSAAGTASAVATALALFLAHEPPDYDSRYKCRRKYNDQNFIPFHYLLPFATAASKAASSTASVPFPMGCLLFQKKIPNPADASRARMMNTVHHQLPTR